MALTATALWRRGSVELRARSTAYPRPQAARQQKRLPHASACALVANGIAAVEPTGDAHAAGHPPSVGRRAQHILQAHARFSDRTAQASRSSVINRLISRLISLVAFTSRATMLSSGPEAAVMRSTPFSDVFGLRAFATSRSPAVSSASQQSSARSCPGKSAKPRWRVDPREAHEWHSRSHRAFH